MHRCSRHCDCCAHLEFHYPACIRIAQPYTLLPQVEGADAKEKDEARGAGGGRQESWVVGILAGLVVAAICGLALVPVVGRAKQCWDFAATAYILHLVACSCYTRFPMVTYPRLLCSHAAACCLSSHRGTLSVSKRVLAGIN